MQRIQNHGGAIAAIAIAALLAVSTATTVAMADDTATSKEVELIALLKSDAQLADKALACKKLAIVGSAAAVPELAKLLPNEQLSSWARIALEAIPGPAADEALRNAAQTLSGKLLVGTLNSIGVRRDAKAVGILAERLAEKDAEVASAAAVALGEVGGEAATKALRQALAKTQGKVRSAVAEGAVLCAEKWLAGGKAELAVAIYDEIRQADVPEQRIVEATRGAILARGDDGIGLLVEQLHSPSRAMFYIGLATAREFPGRKVDAALANEIGKVTPERAALILHAMSDRRETVVLSAVLAAASEGPAAVRRAAIAALGRVGDPASLSPLLAFAQEADLDLAEAAKAALIALEGDEVDRQIVDRLPAAEGKQIPLLLELIGRRQIAALPELIKAVDDSDAAIRGAALTALGQTVTGDKLAVLINQVTQPTYPEDAPIAEKALTAACVRMPDREACAAELTKALAGSSVPTKVALLSILGSMGGAKALETLATAARLGEPELQDKSTQLMGEWMTPDVAPVLLDLVKTAPNEKYQGRAFRGYLRVARQFNLPDEEKIAICRNATAAARNAAERKLVLEAIRRVPHLETLKLAVEAAGTPELKEDATAAALAIAQRLGGQAEAVREQLEKIGFEKARIEIVKAEYGAGGIQKDVTAILREQVGDLPVISLKSPSYNASFGGDPAPNTVKKLKIQYQINGVAGEATFAEDALIVLALPK